MRLACGVNISNVTMSGACTDELQTMAPVLIPHLAECLLLDLLFHMRRQV